MRRSTRRGRPLSPLYVRKAIGRVAWGRGRRPAVVSDRPVSLLVGAATAGAAAACVTSRGSLGRYPVHGFVPRVPRCSSQPQTRGVRGSTAGGTGGAPVWSTLPPGSRPTARGTTWSTGVATRGAPRCTRLCARRARPFTSSLRPPETRGGHYGHTRRGRADGANPSLESRRSRETRPPGPRPLALQLAAHAARARAAPLRQLVHHRAATLSCKDGKDARAARASGR